MQKNDNFVCCMTLRFPIDYSSENYTYPIHRAHRVNCIPIFSLFFFLHQKKKYAKKNLSVPIFSTGNAQQKTDKITSFHDYDRTLAVTRGIHVF